MRAGHFHIGPRPIGEGFPTFVIAEIGVNHNGSADTAIDLIHAARAAGADAVKFQKRSLRDLYVADVLDHTERYERPYQYLMPILERVELSADDYNRVHHAARAAGLQFLCTPFDKPSADFIDRFSPPAYKIASCDLTNFDLIEHVARKGRPMIVSTGASTPEEIDRTVRFLWRCDADFALLHASTSYPTRIEDVNLRVLKWLQNFGVPVGYSGHEISPTVPAAAVALGACIIEKHITLDRNADGPDHRASLMPDEFAAMVRAIRETEKSLGVGEKTVTQGEVLNRELLGKAVVAATSIAAGATISREMLTVKSPARGLSPQRLFDLVGKVARRDFAVDAAFTDDDLAEELVTAPPEDSFGKWGLIVRFDDIALYARHRPKAIEFHMTPPDLKRTYDGPALPCELIVHAPEYTGDGLLDLCALDESQRKKSVRFIQRVIDVAYVLSEKFRGAPKVIVHPGGMSLEPLGAADLLKARAKFAASFETLRERAGFVGVELLPENLPPFPWYYGGQWRSNVFIEPAEIAEFSDEHRTGICLDTSHAQLWCAHAGARLTDFVLDVRPFIRHMHVADARGVNGEGVQIGEGEVPFEDILAILHEYNESWVPEIWQGHLHGGRGFFVAVKRLNELHARAKSLA